MSLDGFLTFVGLMIATYAILSPVSRLRIRLHLYRQLILGMIAIILIGFFQFYSELESIAPSALSPIFTEINLQDQSGNLSNQEAAFLVVIVWLTLALLLHVFAKPRATSLTSLKILSERLHDEGRYLELVELVSPYLGIIKRAVEKKLFGQRLHHWILETHQKAINPFLAISSTGSGGLLSYIARFIKPTAMFVPARRRAYQAALEIEDLLFQSRGVLVLILRLKSKFAFELMDSSGRNASEFRDIFFRSALRDSASQLYRELRDTQNIDIPFGYKIEQKSVILAGFFRDARVAAKYAIWKPIGDEILRMIRNDAEYARLLNGPCPDDEDLLSDPTYNTIHFFDIMVTSAARQNVPDHMWLMYMSIIVRELEVIHNVSCGRADLAAEFPTLGHRLIYEATRCLRGWIRISDHLSTDSVHLNPNGGLEVMSHSILYWAAKDCARAMRYVITSRRLSDQFIKSLLEAYIRDISRLPSQGQKSQLRHMMIYELINGDSDFGRDSLRSEIKSHVRGVDHVVLYNAPDFQDALNEP